MVFNAPSNANNSITLFWFNSIFSLRIISVTGYRKYNIIFMYFYPSIHKMHLNHWNKRVKTPDYL